MAATTTVVDCHYNYIPTWLMLCGNYVAASVACLCLADMTSLSFTTIGMVYQVRTEQEAKMAGKQEKE